MESTKERRIALFIDFENLVTKTGIAAEDFDLQPAIDRLLERGKVVFRRAYCDWSRFKEAKENLHRIGVELVDVPASTRAGKNAADMRLTIDALELCYAREHIDTFVIASGDSDFVPLANKLRENDRIVIGLAVKEATSPHFVNACDEFIYMRGQEKPSRGRPEQREHAKAQAEKKGHHARGAKKEHAKHEGAKGPRAAAPDIPELVSDVVQGLLSRATGPVNPSALKEAIVRKKPDFDERDHGFSTFSKLLAAMEDEGFLRRQQSGRQWYVLPPESHGDGGPDAGHPAGSAAPSSAPAREAEAPASAVATLERAVEAPRQVAAPSREAHARASTPPARAAEGPRQGAALERAPTAPQPAEIARAPAAPARSEQANAAAAPARAPAAPTKDAAPERAAAAAAATKETAAPAAAAPGKETAAPAPAAAPGKETAASAPAAAPAKNAAAPARGAAAPAKDAPAPARAAAATKHAAASARAAAPAKGTAAAPAKTSTSARAAAGSAKGSATPAKAAPASKRQPAARRQAQQRPKPVEEHTYEEEIPDPD